MQEHSVIGERILREIAAYEDISPASFDIATSEWTEKAIPTGSVVRRFR